MHGDRGHEEAATHLVTRHLVPVFAFPLSICSLALNAAAQDSRDCCMSCLRAPLEPHNILMRCLAPALAFQPYLPEPQTL